MHGSTVVAFVVFVSAAPVFARPQTPVQPEAQVRPLAPAAASYDDLVRLYRSGAFERAASELRSRPMTPVDERAMLDWCRTARRADRHEDLAAALMLHTEVILDEVADNPRQIHGNTIVRLHDSLISSVHQRLRGISRTAPALRSWYLLWESFRQGFFISGTMPLSDYLDTALAAFPDDHDLLLAAGSRYEQLWWNSQRNPLRDPSAGPRTGIAMLDDARRYFVRSIAVEPKSIEAHIRLGRTLTLIGKIDEAGEHLTGRALSGIPPYEYVRLLFLGDLHERQGNHGGAATAYEEAIGLTPAAQSARLAAAQLSHRVGRRSDAARGALQAMDTPASEADPWWVYPRGQWWHFRSYLNRSRALVAASSAGSVKPPAVTPSVVKQ
jgi:tetratricopeptide (TPR) repeat protein